MCGIGGIWRRGGGRAEHGELRRMMSALSHRGPEGAAFGRMDRGALILGFLRLGFTGMGLCQQPLYNEDYSIGLVYNGEIYDHMALRADLIGRGHVFRTTSDSEVIIHLYEEHGDRFFEHLNGEFSFVLWDSRKDALLLVRDRFGVKPLLYAWHRDRFVFASEAKGILALDGFTAELDPAHFAGPAIGLADCAVTAFRGIRSVRPGHVMRVTRSGVREEAYWRPPFREVGGQGAEREGGRESEIGSRALSLEEASRAVREVVTRAVRRRMEGDPPMAVSLSSGLDSTIVCGLMAAEARRRGRKLTAFSVGYEGAAHDESAAAERTAAHFGVGFERVSCSAASLAPHFLSAMWSIEVPTNSLSATARIRMTAAVRGAGLKAVMSGEGSDELFGGYPYFGLEAIWRARLGRAQTGSPGGTGTGGQAGGDGGARARGERAWLRFREDEAHSRGIFWDDGEAWRTSDSLFGYPSVYEQRLARMQRDSRRLFSRQWLWAMGEGAPLATAKREFDIAWMRRLSPFDATRALARGMLGSVVIPGLGDRVEMASSLEGRVPYLDREVVELACSLPEEHCIDPATFSRKHVLRRAFADLLPPGFSPPAKTTLMAPSFADLARTAEGRDMLEGLLSDRAIRNAGVFDPTFVRLLRAGWQVWPKQGRQHARMDLLMGYVACTQALHHVLVDDGLGKRGSLRLLALDEDRTPPLDGASPGGVAGAATGVVEMAGAT